jgi:hypothetical protein
MMTSMTQKMLPRRVDGFGNIIVPDYPSVEALMKIGNPENTRHHEHLMNLMQSAYAGKDDVEDMMYAMNDTHGGAWYDDLWEGIKDVGKFLWDNKSDIINVAKAVAPLVGGGMEFDDAYEDVVGGAVSRYAHTLSDLKHFTFPALQAYIAKINKNFKYDRSNVPKSEKKYINGIRKLKNLRLRQRGRSTKLFEKGEKAREKYMSSHKTSLGLFLPRSKSRKSGYMNRAEANDINLDLGEKNRDAIIAAKKELDKSTYEALLSEIDEIHKEGKSRLSFNKAVKAVLLEHGLDVGETKTTKKPKAPIVIAKSPVAAVKEPFKITVQNQKIIKSARDILKPEPYNRLLAKIKNAGKDAKTKRAYNQEIFNILVDEAVALEKVDKKDVKITLPSKELELPPPSYGAPDSESEEDYEFPPPDDDDEDYVPPPAVKPEKRATGRPLRRTTRKKSTRKPAKKSKKSRKVRLI